ncbi:MAG: BrnT family toxin [Pyrinomonadaceae bacterium]
MDFEWDENKAAGNIQKHGVSFDSACLAFFDDWAIEDIDDAYSNEDEKRFIIVGLAGSQLLRVVYTVRAKIRIISAEKARPFERDAYNENRNEHDR